MQTAFLHSFPRSVAVLALQSQSAKVEGGYSDLGARLSLYLDVDALSRPGDAGRGGRPTVRSWADYARIWGWTKARVQRAWPAITLDVWAWCSNQGRSPDTLLAERYRERVAARFPSAFQPASAPALGTPATRSGPDPPPIHERSGRDPKTGPDRPESPTADPPPIRERSTSDPHTNQPSNPATQQPSSESSDEDSEAPTAHARGGAAAAAAGPGRAKGAAKDKPAHAPVHPAVGIVRARASWTLNAASAEAVAERFPDPGAPRGSAEAAAFSAELAAWRDTVDEIARLGWRRNITNWLRHHDERLSPDPSATGQPAPHGARAGAGRAPHAGARSGYGRPSAGPAPNLDPGATFRDGLAVALAAVAQ